MKTIEINWGKPDNYLQGRDGGYFREYLLCENNDVLSHLTHIWIQPPTMEQIEKSQESARLYFPDLGPFRPCDIP